MVNSELMFSLFVNFHEKKLLPLSPGVEKLANNIRSMYGLQVGIFTKYICWGAIIPILLIINWFYTFNNQDIDRVKLETSGGYPIPVYLKCKWLFVLYST